MSKQLTRQMLACFIALLTVVGLSSCGGLQGTPPKNIVSQAIVAQAQADQITLWQQLSLPMEATPALSVKQVRIRQTRSVLVASELAYEIAGTYQYRLQYPHRRKIEQSQVPFTVVLQAIPESKDWQLLQIENDESKDRQWYWEPFMGDRT